MKVTKTIFAGIWWLGRGTATIMGLAVILALVVGVASTALGANGGNFILGQNNVATALTKLTGNVNGSTLQVANTNPGADDSALTLSVPDGEAPMVVSSDAKVKRLNVEKVDGRSFECPGGTLFEVGACIGTTNRDPAFFINANEDCFDEGGRLPTVAELQTFRNRPGTDFGNKELSSGIFSNGQETLVHTVSSEGFVFFDGAGERLRYRCVVPPG